MPISGDTIQGNPPRVGKTVRPLVETYPATQGLDPLTRHVRSVRALSTGSFTGSADAVIDNVSVANRFRAKSVVFMASADASSNVVNGSTFVLKISENGQQTGIDWQVFIAQNQVVGGNGGIWFQMDLDEGWVSGQATQIKVAATVGNVVTALATGHFYVVMIGSEEQAN